MPERARAFIASSREQLELAHAVQEELEADFETQVWDQDTFGLSEYPLDALLSVLHACDIGIFILAADDITTMRGKPHPVPRDNVLFELGLFAGGLGRERCFLLVPRSKKDLHLPSDLNGVTTAQYDDRRSDENLRAALGPACNKIRKAVRKRSATLPATVTASLFNQLAEEFEQRISTARHITLSFIHSRRWRENHNDALQAFLDRDGTNLLVFLPDLENQELIRALHSHFDDGPFIPSFVADAYRYFAGLKQAHQKQVTVRLFRLYPTYTLYQFDDTCILVLYPTTAMRRTVPTFHFTTTSPFGTFVTADTQCLLTESHEATAEALLATAANHIQEPPKVR